MEKRNPKSSFWFGIKKKATELEWHAEWGLGSLCTKCRVNPHPMGSSAPDSCPIFWFQKDVHGCHSVS